ncbi:MAG: NUDIX hydrolase [Beutenbergiaceae bacterium]
MSQRPSQLGPQWRPGVDGMLFRRAARVLLLDQDDRILLVRGHDVDDPTRGWWFTIGGGLDPAETSAQAASRELREETGIVIDPDQLIGPVMRREARFDFQRATVRQQEEFFLARVHRPPALLTDGWTDIERGFMDELRWFTLAQLQRIQIELFPERLPQLLPGWIAGWDGTLLDLGLDVDGTGS